MEKNYYSLMRGLLISFLFISLFLLTACGENKLGNTLVEREYLTKENINKVYIDDNNPNIIINKNNINETKIIYYEDKDHKYAVEARNNVISVIKDKSLKDKNSSKSYSLKIYLPSKEYDLIDCNSLNGDIEINSINSKEFNMNNDSGDINLNSINAGMIVTSNDNGDIKIKDISFNKFICNNTNGDIEGTINGIKTDYNIFVKTNSEHINLENSYLDNKQADKEIKINDLNGDINNIFRMGIKLLVRYFYLLSCRKI